jgi:hypothetical protein
VFYPKTTDNNSKNRDWTMNKIMQHRKNLVDWAINRWGVDFSNMKTDMNIEFEPDDEILGDE